eukprot:2904693-Rhodomonas_salina.2
MQPPSRAGSTPPIALRTLCSPRHTLVARTVSPYAHPMQSPPHAGSTHRIAYAHPMQSPVLTQYAVAHTLSPYPRPMVLRTPYVVYGTDMIGFLSSYALPMRCLALNQRVTLITLRNQMHGTTFSRQFVPGMWLFAFDFALPLCTVRASPRLVAAIPGYFHFVEKAIQVPSVLNPRPSVVNPRP